MHAIRERRPSTPLRRSANRPRVVVAGLGDTGVLVATRLARRFDVVGISTRPALVSGQELGRRLTDPGQWRSTFLVPFRRFRRLDRVRVAHGRITSADLAGSEVEVEGTDGRRTREPYDWLVIATGASNGFWRHDRVEDLPTIHSEHDEVQSRIDSAGTVAIVGGGPTGVGVADNLARRGTQEVHLFHSGDLPLPGYHPRARTWVADRLRADGVRVHPGHRAVLPEGIDTDRIASEPVEWSTGQPPFGADATVWALGRVRPHTAFLPAEVLDGEGFVRVDEHLRVPGYPNVFALGDVAASDPNRSSARNFGYRVVVGNLERLARHGRGRLRTFRAPEHRWGSVFGVQEDGLVILQPDGRRVRVPRWIARQVLLRVFVETYLYGGLRPAARDRPPEDRRDPPSG